MLIVKDLTKLKDYGFEQTALNQSPPNIWGLDITDTEGNQVVSLLVNPYGTEHKENELFVYVCSDNMDDKVYEHIDSITDVSILFKMYADGVLEVR